MNIKLIKMMIRGFYRRRKEIMRACIVAFLSIFFISGVLLFQENMYQWQMVENRERFGDWFLIENYQQTKALEDHPYLTKALTAASYAMMYDQNWNRLNIKVGYMSPEFMKKGNIMIVDGRMPESEHEIACDYNTLSKLGYTAQLGQEIHFNYFNDDNPSSSEEPEKSASFVLTGVLKNFTDSWSVMRFVPGALLSQEGCKQLSAKSNMVYMYGLKDNMRSDNYDSIYAELSSYNSKKVSFNTDVYDFKPWGPKSIYTYIYVLVMVIGTAALSYQVIIYQHSRNEYYFKLFRLGSTKATIFSSRSIENLLIMLPSGLIGILGAILTGRIIGWILECKKGIAFFNINLETVLRSLLALLVAFALGVLVNIFVTFSSQLSVLDGRTSLTDMNKRSKNSKSHSHQKHAKLKRNNAIWQLHVRFSHSNGIFMRIGARLFSFFIAIVLVFCAYNIYSAFNQYTKISAKADISGFQVQDGSVKNFMHFAYDTKQKKALDYSPFTTEYYIANSRPWFSKDEYIDYKNKVNEIKDNDQSATEMTEESGMVDFFLTDKYCKLGNSTIVHGIDDNLKNTIANTNGIKSITYSTYESARDWDWDGRQMSASELAKLTSDSKKMSGYCDTYMYGTEYIDPTQEFYDRISKYIDPSNVDYNAFKNGDQIVVFLKKKANNMFDETINPGTMINFHYYLLPVTSSLSNLNDFDKNQDEKQYVYPYWRKFADQCIDKYYEEYGKAYYSGRKFYVDTDVVKTNEYYDLYYQLLYEPCVSSKVAAVVQVTDDVQKDLSDLITDFGYYTAIASSELGKKACDNQNTLMSKFVGQEAADEMKCEFQYNQLTATYDLSSSFSATDNILSSYFRANNVTYLSSANDKEMYRTNVLDALLQYGTTMIATIVINILIYSILTKNRLELRRNKLILLLRLGADKSRLRRICMIEIIREALWCIFTAPLQILVQYLICRRTISLYK